MSVVDVAPLTDALVAFLASLTGRPVGDGRLPTQADPPFAVVYQIPGGEFWGAEYADAQAGAAVAYQITSVDVTRAGAELHADSIRHALCDRLADGSFVDPLTAAGLVVLDRELISFDGVDSDQGVFNARDTYWIHVTRP